MSRKRTGPRFDAEQIFSLGEPGMTDVVPAKKDRWTVIHKGVRARWAGTKGKMMEVPASMVMPMQENIWYPDRMVDYAAAIRAGVLLDPPAARIHIVGRSLVEESRERVDEGELLYPFEEEDIDQPYAVLLDGNHRAFAAAYSFG